MKTETKEIGGQRYRMTQVGAETGEQIVLRLTRPLVALFAKVVKEGETAKVADVLATGLAPALAELSAADLRFVRKKLAGKTQLCINLKAAHLPEAWVPLAEQYDSHFAGRYKEAFAFLAWGIEMNRFFGDVPALMRAGVAAMKKATAAAESLSSSPPGADGGSGVSSSTPETASRV